jgi:hypothetical protein
MVITMVAGISQTNGGNATRQDVKLEHIAGLKMGLDVYSTYGDKYYSLSQKNQDHLHVFQST